jgi:RHS repeat-associated protein
VFTPDQPINGDFAATVSAASLQDEWLNPIAAQSVTVTNNGSLPQGGVAYTGPPINSTASAPAARSTIESPFLFHGQVFDYDTGLVYLRARYYDPSTGLFLQPDPMGFEDSANLYVAFVNNPINLSDPSGTTAISEFFDSVDQKATDALIRYTYSGGSEFLAGTAFWGLQFLNIATDTLRLGEGLETGTFRGWVEDGLRALQIITVSGKAAKALQPTAAALAASRTAERLGPISRTLKTAKKAEAHLAHLDEVLQEAARLEKQWPQQIRALRESGQVLNLASIEEGTETFYRTMKPRHYKRLRATGKIPPTSETFTTPDPAYARRYTGVTVKFEVKAGTTEALRAIGVRHPGLSLPAYASLPLAESGRWTLSRALFKLERNVVNIGLGRGAALDLFNRNIVKFSEVPRL